MSSKKMRINTKNAKTKKNRHHATAINDFYFHVNNSWISSNKLTKNTSQKNDFVVLKDKVNKQLLNVLKEVVKETTPNSKRCKALYKSMTIWNDPLVSEYFYLFQRKIEEFTKTPDVNNLHTFLGWCIKNGVIAPIDFGLINDVKKPDRYIAAIGENGFAFNSKEVYLSNKKEYVNVRTVYKKLIQDAFDLFFGQNHCFDASDAFEVEMSLAKHMHSLEDSVSPIKTYNKVYSPYVKQYCLLDFELLLKEINMENVKYVNIINPKYVSHAMKVMKKEWTSKKWHSYWIFKLLVYFSRFHSKLHEHFSGFIMLTSGELKPEDIEETSVQRICEIMHSTMSKKYVEIYKNPKEIVFAENLTNKIMEAFRYRLENNQWMKESTKKKALLKLDKMITAIGYRDKYPKDPDCDFLPNDDFGNHLKYLTWLLKKFRKEVNHKIIDNQYWLKTEEMNVYDVNAYYNNVENEIILPNALLQKPFVDLEKGFIYNLARIGFAIAHEMIHAFDVHGSLFDEKGGLNYWWSKEDIEKYKKIQKEVIEQYEKTALKDGVKLNGDLTLSENIADISGFHIIEDVLKKETMHLNEEEKNRQFKQLYENYALQWRTIETSSKEKYLLEIDNHSLSKYRVNCVLMRSNIFKNVFGVQPGDAMSFEHENENEIW